MSGESWKVILAMFGGGAMGNVVELFIDQVFHLTPYPNASLVGGMIGGLLYLGMKLEEKKAV